MADEVERETPYEIAVTPELARGTDGQPSAPAPGGGERPAPRSSVRPERGSDRER